MELQLTTASGAESKKALEVQDAVFDVPYNEPLIHEAVVAYLSNVRQGSKAQKNRSDVSGGGAKPWRQKGTGRARAGTIRSPIWRSGGTTFAARPRSYTKKMNKRAYRLAMKSIFSELVRQDRLVIVEKFDSESFKTKDVLKSLNAVGVAKASDTALVIVESLSESLYFSTRNLRNVLASDVFDIDPATLIAFDKVLITQEAVKLFEGQLS